jgi:hypothetical protein
MVCCSCRVCVVGRDAKLVATMRRSCTVPANPIKGTISSRASRPILPLTELYIVSGGISAVRGSFCAPGDAITFRQSSSSRRH